MTGWPELGLILGDKWVARVKRRGARGEGGGRRWRRRRSLGNGVFDHRRKRKQRRGTREHVETTKWLRKFKRGQIGCSVSDKHLATIGRNRRTKLMPKSRQDERRRGGLTRLRIWNEIEDPETGRGINLRLAWSNLGSYNMVEWAELT